MLSGQSYVPVNFLYGTAVAPSASLSVSITSPASNATLSGTASMVVATTGSVASLQLQVDGANQGNAVPVSASQGPSYTLSLDTTALSSASHTLAVAASDTQSSIVTSAPVTVTVNNPVVSTSTAAFVLGQTPGPIRNNYPGFVGMALKVGSTAEVVTSLGRFVAPGNSSTHLLKLVNSNGTDVSGGSVSVSLAGAVSGTFLYGVLSAPHHSRSQHVLLLDEPGSAER